MGNYHHWYSVDLLGTLLTAGLNLIVVGDERKDFTSHLIPVLIGKSLHVLFVQFA
jgi:hypothetical protein